MAIGPTTGSYSMLFTSKATATYPSTGLGATTETPEDSFVATAHESVVEGIYVPLGVAESLEFYHFDDTQAASYQVASSVVHPYYPIPEGLRLRGNWYVLTTGTSGLWTIHFRVTEGI